MFVEFPVGDDEGDSRAWAVRLTSRECAASSNTHGHWSVVGEA